MFNTLHKILKKTFILIITLSLVFSCSEEIKIEFKEDHFEASKDAEISINYPKAEGGNAVSELINTTIQNYIVNQMNLSEDSLTNLSIGDAIKRFNADFVNFKTDFPESSQKWEAFIDGEITYRSTEIICIAINSYLDTGGAHGNTNITFFNFNSQTGKLYPKTELFNTIDALSEIIAKQLKEELKSDASMEAIFFGKDFQLPESLGFSDEGLIVLYNPYEIASYSQGIIEFTIPYEDISSYLNKH